MDEVRPNPLDIARDMHAHPALVHLLEQHLQLQLGEPRPDAAVDTVAKRKVSAGILAGDIEFVSVYEHFLVAVGREIP